LHSDYHKLTFFYYAEKYVNFNDLVVDIFKAYKIRIWMSAVNPASVVNPHGTIQIQPPSLIGPGAILPSRAGRGGPAVGPGFGGARGSPQSEGMSTTNLLRGFILANPALVHQNLTTPNTYYQHTLLPFVSQYTNYNTGLGVPQWTPQGHAAHQAQQNPYRNGYQPSYPATTGYGYDLRYTTGVGGQGVPSTAPGYNGSPSAPYDPTFLAANMQNLNFRNN
jgi:hypothetical protein